MSLHCTFFISFHASHVVVLCCVLSKDFNFAADDVATVYVDGELAATTSQLHVASSLTVSSDACVIAVEVRNTLGENKGFVASGSNGVLTDSSWRCTSYEDEGWNRRNHNDIRWYRAHEQYLNDATSPLMATIDGISPQAHYIWSAETADPIVSFCRLDLCTSCDTITDLYARAGCKIEMMKNQEPVNYNCRVLSECLGWTVQNDTDCNYQEDLGSFRVSSRMDCIDTCIEVRSVIKH